MRRNRKQKNGWILGSDLHSDKIGETLVFTTNEQWREEVWWYLGRLLDCMPAYQILVLISGVGWSLLLYIWRFLTSKHDVIFTFANRRFGKVCWHNIHIILHALSLLVVAQWITVMNINYQRSKLGDRRNTVLNAKAKRSHFSFHLFGKQTHTKNNNK